jgi:hypothetical protein
MLLVTLHKSAGCWAAGFASCEQQQQQQQQQQQTVLLKQHVHAIRAQHDDLAGGRRQKRQAGHLSKSAEVALFSRANVLQLDSACIDMLTRTQPTLMLYQAGDLADGMLDRCGSCRVGAAALPCT